MVKGKVKQIVFENISKNLKGLLGVQTIGFKRKWFGKQKIQQKELLLHVGLEENRKQEL